MTIPVRPQPAVASDLHRHRATRFGRQASPWGPPPRFCRQRRSRAMPVALGLALALHLLLIFGISMRAPQPQVAAAARTLDLFVVTASGPEPPRQDAIAAQVDRVGETLAALPDLSADVREVLDTSELVASLGPESSAATAESEPAVAPELDLAAPTLAASIPVVLPTADPVAEPAAPVAATAMPPPITALRPAAPPSAADILASRNDEVAAFNTRMAAQHSSGHARRKALSSATREYRYASYMEAWRQKVERVGNLNYPSEARQRGVYGSLMLHVAVRADGSLEGARVVRSSGHQLLDQAALRIVELAAPFAPFPPDLRAEVDVLDITRTWQFERNNRLGWDN